MRKVIKVMALMAFVGASFQAHADEAGVKAALQKRYPDVKVESVSKTPLPGLYEVYTGGQIIYTDEQARYRVFGPILDDVRNVNVTEERIGKLTAINFETLPLDLAIKQVKGNGARKLAVFTDPDCPYCRELQKNLEGVSNVTIYYFLFPIVNLHPNAMEISRSVWCSPDRTQAWLDYMATAAKPKAAGTCNTPVDKITAFGRSRGINSTPTLILADGQRVSGALPAAQLEQRLGATVAKP